MPSLESEDSQGFFTKNFFTNQKFKEGESSGPPHVSVIFPFFHVAARDFEEAILFYGSRRVTLS